MAFIHKLHPPVSSLNCWIPPQPPPKGGRTGWVRALRFQVTGLGCGAVRTRAKDTKLARKLVLDWISFIWVSEMFFHEQVNLLFYIIKTKGYIEKHWSQNYDLKNWSEFLAYFRVVSLARLDLNSSRARPKPVSSPTLSQQSQEGPPKARNPICTVPKETTRKFYK